MYQNRLVYFDTVIILEISMGLAKLTLGYWSVLRNID